MLLLCAVLGVCSYVFLPSGYVRFIMNQATSGEEQYDTVFLGASHGRNAWDPNKLDEELGTNTLNLCIPSETVNDSYYLLKESDRTNDIKTIIFDFDYQYWYDLVDNEFSDAFIYYYMKPSLVKLQYMTDNLLKKDFRVSAAGWVNYINDFKDVKSLLAQKNTDDYKNCTVEDAKVNDGNTVYKGKGFCYITYPNKNKGPMRSFEWDDTSLDKAVEDKFIKMAEYCKNNNIELIAVSSAISPAMVMNGASKESSEYFTELTNRYGVKFYDMNLIKNSVMPRTNDDFIDWDGHMCGSLAEKHSEVLTQIIKAERAGTFNKSDYFYDSYEEFNNAFNKVVYTYGEISYLPVEEGSDTFNVKVEADAVSGTENSQAITPEYEFIIGTPEGIVAHGDYSSSNVFETKLKRGTYTVRVNSRKKGSKEAYDTYHESALVIE